MAAPLPWAILSVRPERAWSSPSSMNCAAIICATALPPRALAAARALPWSLRPCITSAVPTCSNKSLRKCYFPIRIQSLDRHLAQIVGTVLGRTVSATLLHSRRSFFRHWPAASPTRKSMAIQKVGVAGCGLMGSGIAQVAAQAGFPVVVREVQPELVEKGLKSIEKNLARLVEKGTITEAAKNEIRGRLKGTTALEDLKDCDVIVEAI